MEEAMEQEALYRRIGRSVLWLLVLFSAGCAATVQPKEAAAPPKPNPPVFDDSFTVSSMWLGKVLRIYVEGHDPDGDMSHIWFVVSQLGGHMWSNHTVRLEGSKQANFKGYVELPTPSFRSRSGWETLRIEMKIRDQVGHYSGIRVHEVRLGKPTKEEVPSKWADAERLGVIFFDFDLGGDGEESDGMDSSWAH
jgi:hypothetical protein